MGSVVPKLYERTTVWVDIVVSLSGQAATRSRTPCASLGEDISNTARAEHDWPMAGAFEQPGGNRRPVAAGASNPHFSLRIEVGRLVIDDVRQVSMMESGQVPGLPLGGRAHVQHPTGLP